METSKELGARSAFSRRIEAGWTFLGSLLALCGGVISLLVGCLLVFYLLSRLSGSRPDARLLYSFLPWLVLGAGPLCLGRVLLHRTRTPEAHWFKRVVLVVPLLFAVLGMDALFGATDAGTSSPRDKLFTVGAEGLRATVVSPHLEVDIVPGINVLWCGTFQLCWNEVCDLTGGDLQFANLNPALPGDAMAAALNRRAFTKDSLDNASYVALAGFVTNAIHDQIERAVKKKFHGAFKPRFLPSRLLTPRPQDIAAYACLYKKLTFPQPFERLNEWLRFGDCPVGAFGLGPTTAQHDKLCAQVLILDYRSEDDFVIELKTKSSGDRLILAKVQPQRKLADTVAAVQERAQQGQREETGPHDILVIPRMNFDLNRQYTELEQLQLIPRNPALARDLRLLSAVQDTRFEMNEKGVELKSEAQMSFSCGMSLPPPPEHRLIFNKPFLVMMARTEAKGPYFALWVDNAELLVPR
jgi:hypothetical protein